MCVPSPRRVVLGYRGRDVGRVMCDAGRGRVCVGDGMLEFVESVCVTGFPPGAVDKVVLVNPGSSVVYHRPPPGEALDEGSKLCRGVAEGIYELAVYLVVCVRLLWNGVVVTLGL